MKKAFGVIELLIAFLLISIIVAGFMKATLMQMQTTENTTIEDARQKADEMIENIENIRQQNAEYEEQMLNETTDEQNPEDVSTMPAAENLPELNFE